MKIILLTLNLLLCTAISTASPSIGGYNVYYGHLHNHTIYSDGGGTPAQAYNYAKNKAKLDFFGISDHDSYLDSLKWADTKAQADSYNQDGVFSTFYGFEWSSTWTYGHITIIGTPDYTTSVITNNFDKLKIWLSDRSGIAFFNHPGREDANNLEFDHFNSSPSNKFVGVELWNKDDGFSTFYYNDGYTNNDNSKGFYDEALNSGWKVGAAGSGDDHSATWGTAEDSRLAILSNNLTRNDLWGAMLARRFYSTLDKNLALSFKINNLEMGSAIIPGTYTLRIQANDADSEIFTNVKLFNKAHNVIVEWTPNSTFVDISANLTIANGDFYYIKVTEADGDEAISSPIWVENQDSQSPSAFEASIGTITHNSVELLLNATDNSGTVNYTISYGSLPTVINVSGFSGTQKSYVVTGLTASTNYSFSIVAKDDALNQTTNSPIVLAAKTSTLPTYKVASSPAVQAPYSLTYLTDGNSSTSWRVLSPTVSFITFKYINAQTINKLTLTSSNDNASRDPKSWIVKASNDTLAGWTTLDTQTNQSFSGRELAKTYTFTNSAAYKYYRLHITASNYSTTSTMLGEMMFWSDNQTPAKDMQAPTAFTAATGTVTQNSIELLLNATDNSGTINYKISYGAMQTEINLSGISGIQKSYIVSGLTAGTNYSFTIIAKDTAMNQAANSPITISAKTTSIPAIPKDTLPPLAFTAIPGTVTQNSIELLLNATDNSGTINYKISYGAMPTEINLSGISGIQKSYIVSGLTAGTNYSFTIIAKDTAMNQAANSPITISAKTTSTPVIPKDTLPPLAFTAIAGTVTQNSIELLLNATDSSGTIKYTISYGTVPTVINLTGTAGTQKSYIVTGLTAGTNYSFSIVAKDTAMNQTTNSPLIVVAKTTSAPAYTVKSSPTVLSPYSLAYLTDGNSATSWRVLSPTASYITFEYSAPQIINKITLTSSTDNASRDPKSWTVKASNDTIAGWRILDSRTNQTFATRELAKTYSFANNTAYKFYRLHITASNYSTTSTMLGELSFGLDIDTTAPTAFTASLGAITPNSVELLLNATDDSGLVYYTVSYGAAPTVVTLAGTSATQMSYTITGLNPSINYIFTVTCNDAALNPAANNPITVTAKTTEAPAYTVTSSPAVVAPYSLAYLTDGNSATSWRVLSPTISYITFTYTNPSIINNITLTSSNDNASRDPKSWIVKASNDTVGGWTILDTRTNQTFATRELAKTYTFTNSTAYKFYRLHITASNYSTTSTMLGEMAFGEIASGPVNIRKKPLENTDPEDSESTFGQTNHVEKRFNIYSLNRTLYIQNPTTKSGDLYLYNIYGRLIMKQTFESNSVTSISLNLPAGSYLVIGISPNEKMTKNILLP